VREPVEASGTSGSCPEAGGRQWKSVEDKEGVRRGSGGSGEVREVWRRSGRPWESAEEGGKGTGSNGTLQYLPLKAEPSRPKDCAVINKVGRSWS